MGSFLLGIGVLGFLTFIVLGFIGVFKKNSKGKKRFLIAAGFLVLMIIGNTISPESKETSGSTAKVEKKDTSKQKAEEAKKPLTLEQKITNELNKKLGEKSNTDKKRIAKLEINDNLGTDPQGDKIVLVTLAGDENLTTNMTRKGLLMDSEKVFKAIFQNKEVSDATVFWQETLTDAYGKDSDENVVKISMTRNTYNKINWDNFNFENYNIVADSFYVHPALTK